MQTDFSKKKLKKYLGQFYVKIEIHNVFLFLFNIVFRIYFVNLNVQYESSDIKNNNVQSDTVDEFTVTDSAASIGCYVLLLWSCDHETL